MSNSPWSEGTGARDAVGAAWARHLRGEGYGPAGDVRFLARFRASPYIQLILRYVALAPDSLILEPGCGSGKFSLALASLGHRVVAFDYVAGVLRGVRVIEQRLAGQWPGQLRGYCQGSLERLPFPDNTFDLVVNEGVVEHWLDEAARVAVIAEMVRVTRPGGAVAVLVPNGVHPLMRVWETRLEGFHAAPLMTYYSAGQLGLELAQAGLRDVYTDGIYPWRSWFRIPPWDRLYLVGAALDHWGPLPRTLCLTWAINLIGVGQKDQCDGGLSAPRAHGVAS
jgi:SAM-dependent methyltransferase